MMLPAIWHYAGLTDTRREWHRLVHVVAVYPLKHTTNSQLAVLYDGSIHIVESSSHDRRVSVFATEDERAKWFLEREFKEGE